MSNNALVLDLAATLIETSHLVPPPEARRLALAVRTLNEPTFARAANALPRLRLPKRKKNAPTGSAFMASIYGMKGDAREHAIAEQILAGNVPRFMHVLKPVKVTGKVRGKPRELTFFTSVDFLAIGIDDDYVRIAMTPTTARRIAKKLGCTVPTAKMVEHIYRKADLKMVARPWATFSDEPRNKNMGTSRGYALHEDAVTRELMNKGKVAKRNFLIAGHKKTLVLPYQENNSITFYGFFKKDGTPWERDRRARGIRSRAHHGHPDHVDYSHGVRLIYRSMLTDNGWMPLLDVLNNKDYYPLIAPQAFGSID